jgi:hypothetical protein
MIPKSGNLFSEKIMLGVQECGKEGAAQARTSLTKRGRYNGKAAAAAASISAATRMSTLLAATGAKERR